MGAYFQDGCWCCIIKKSRLAISHGISLHLIKFEFFYLPHLIRSTFNQNQTIQILIYRSWQIFSRKMASVFNFLKTFLIPNVKAQDDVSNPQEELKVFNKLFIFFEIQFLEVMLYSTHQPFVKLQSFHLNRKSVVSGRKLQLTTKNCKRVMTALILEQKLKRHVPKNFLTTWMH